MKKDTCLKILDVIEQWIEDHDIETSPHNNVELAQRLYDKLFVEEQNKNKE